MSLPVPLTFWRLAAALEQLPFSPIAIALTACHYAAERIPVHDSGTGEIHATDCAILEIAAFCRELPNPGLPPFKVMQPETVEPLLREIAKMPPGLRPEPGTIAALIAAQATLASLAGHQMYRALFLLELVSAPTDDENPYDELFLRTYGCSTEEYTALFLHTITQSTKSKLLDKNCLKPSVATHVRAAYPKILAANAISARALASAAAAGIPQLGTDGFAHRLFTKKPLIEIGPELYAPPPHPYARLAVAMSYLHALELARRLRGRLDTPESQRMGERFELLLQHLFEQLPGASVHREAEYLRKRNDKSPDLTVLESSNTAVVVEAKIRRLPYDAFYGAEPNALEQESDELARPIRQLVRYLHKIHEAPHRIRPDHEQVARALREAPRIAAVGVFAALPPLFHAEQYRRTVSAAVDRSLTQNELSWWRSQEHRIRWHVMDSEDATWFMALLRRDEFAATMHRYLNSPGFGRLLDDRKAPASFGAYVREVARARGGGSELALVDDAMEDFFGRASELVDPGFRAR